MSDILINNLKGIRQLRFCVPSSKGVYLLVGPNGAGKTTLLVCMDRICNPYAFAYYFKSSRVRGIDQYDSSRVNYSNGENTISYRKGNSRWAVAPRGKAAEILSSFAFERSIFIRADSKRIEPSEADIRQGRLESVNPQVKDALNQIFETQKYSQLQHLKISNGRGRPATYFYVIDDGREQYSEKRFSSGELAVVKLIEQLHDTPNKSLVLLDEAEMALHPRVQINLLDYLTEQQQLKDLMIFISTHSPALIYKTYRKNIILLELLNGESVVHYECYPAKAVGTVDNIENSGFDYHFFVKDIMAKILLKKMIKKYLSMVAEHVTALINIIPVGGYLETSWLAIRTKNRVFANSKVFAVLDEDAFSDGIHENASFGQLYSEHHETIRSLGCTPEKWIINCLENNSGVLIDNIRNQFHCEYRDIINNRVYLQCSDNNERKLAKKKFDAMISLLISRSGENEESVIDSFVELVVSTLSDGRIMELLNPLFRYQRDPAHV